MFLRLILALLLLLPVPALAQNFPPLTGRVVDQADLLTPQQEADLTARLEAVQQSTSRQFVVATVPSLEGREIEEYGYQLGRHWGIGQSEANNGLILLVAPNERKVRIEVGYGLEGIMTDALSHAIIQNDILPRFRENDYPGGILAGSAAIIAQLQAPPEAAEQRALEAANAAASARSGEGSGGGSAFPLLFWIIVMVAVFVPLLRSGLRGRRYRGRRRGGPIVIWGPGMGGWSGGSSSSSSSGGGWSSGGSSWGGGGGGGFSGGGGSFGGGGASGGW